MNKMDTGVHIQATVIDATYFGKRGVDMDMVTKKSVKGDLDIDTKFLENRGVDMYMVWNRCPPNFGK